MAEAAMSEQVAAGGGHTAAAAGSHEAVAAAGGNVAAAAGAADFEAGVQRLRAAAAELSGMFTELWREQQQQQHMCGEDKAAVQAAAVLQRFEADLTQSLSSLQRHLPTPP